MCGISCMFTNTSRDINLSKDFNIFKENITKRGPDSFDVNKYFSENLNLLFAASVLWLQGKSITKQPLEDDTSVFVYNGDIFNGISDKQREEEGDTKLLFKMMKNEKKVYVALNKIQGPYAFIYFDKREGNLYFGRDIYGRRSLLLGKSRNIFILTSVAKRSIEYDFMELPSIGTFCWNLRTNQLSIFTWPFRDKNFNIKLTEIEKFLNKKIFIEQEINNEDSVKFTEPNITHLSLLKQIKNLEINDAFEILLNNPGWLSRVLKMICLLEEAIKKRIATQPKFCINCITEKIGCNHSLTGVLFSGGIDCSILALLADKFVDSERPIDLMNVAFDEVNNYQTPDRLTGLETLKELRQLRPQRKWNFVEINVTQKELDEKRKHHIADVIYPLKSILDDSLGCALWFASRGERNSVISPCRVLLVGMGADELFGGYTRHRSAFKKKSWIGLFNALNEDWQNLSHRNLARDDRVVSDHGRQLRTPFLDENFVKYVRNLNSWEKTYPSDEVPQGLGEKYLLRSLGYYIGLKNAASFKKRALQFGSRIANKKENAHDISLRLCM